MARGKQGPEDEENEGPHGFLDAKVSVWRVMAGVGAGWFVVSVYSLFGPSGQGPQPSWVSLIAGGCIGIFVFVLAERLSPGLTRASRAVERRQGMEIGAEIGTRIGRKDGLAEGMKIESYVRHHINDSAEREELLLQAWAESVRNVS